MTPHENALILIKEFNYNTREIGEILNVAPQTIEKKIKLVKYNKFSESDFQKLLFHFQNKIEKQNLTNLNRPEMSGFFRLSVANFFI